MRAGVESRTVLSLLVVACVAFIWHVSSGCCTESDSVTALNVAVKDGSTGAFLCDARVAFRDGDWSEVPAMIPIAHDNSCRYHGANDRAGTYVISIARRGFITKVVEDVDVDKPLCRVEPRVLEVTLDRDPNAPAEDFQPIDGGSDGG